MPMNMRLVVGAGTRRVAGFTHHDVQKLPGIDICCEFFNLPDHVAARSCQEIHMTHVLEHFPIGDTQRVLRLLHALLAPAGKLYLEVPNFQWHAQGILRNPMDRKIVEYAYGGQHDRWDFHYNGFTPDILTDDLITADFRIDALRPNSSIECWCTKA